MPKIITYQPNQVQSKVISQPLAQSAPAAAFGGDVAKGLSDVAKVSFDIKQRIDTTSAEEASLNFEREKNDILFNPDKGYFNTSGRDAYDKSTDTTKAIEKLKLKYGETLNPQAKMLFDGVADKHIEKTRVGVAQHASKGMKAWEVATIKAEVENSVENASLYWGDSKELSVQRERGLAAIRDSARLEGIPLESATFNEQVQTFNSTYSSAAVSAALMQGSGAAKELMTKLDKTLEGPDKIKLQKAIEAKQKVEKTQADAQAAVLTASVLVDKYDDLKDITKEVDKIKDLELREKTRSEVNSRHSAKRRAEAEFQADSFEDGEDTVYKTGSIEQWKSQNADKWESLNEKQKRQLESGGVSSSDMNVFTDLMLLPKDENGKEKLAKINPNDYAHLLAKSERKSLINAVKVARGLGSDSDKIDHQEGRTRASQTKAAIEQMLAQKSSKWTKVKMEKANELYSLIDDEHNRRKAEKGANLTSSEYTDMLSDISTKVVKEGMIFDDQLDITAAADDLGISNKDTLTLVNYLRSKGKVVNIKNLQEAYKQATSK